MIAVDYVSKSVNNVSYTGNGAVNKIVADTTGTVVKNVTSSTVANVTALRVGGSVLSRVNPYLFAAKTIYDIGSAAYEYLTEDEKAELTPVEREAVNQVEEYAKNLDYQKQKTEDLKQKTDEISNSVTYEQGQSLPSVLTQNAKALTQSVNTLNSTMNEQMTLQNNNFQGLLIYLEQFLQLQTELAPLKIDAMNYQKNSAPAHVLNATNVSGLSPRDIQVSKHSYDIEAKEYARSPQTVNDWDENTLADIAPREARLVKDATVAIKTTDENNFQLDDDDIDIASPIDISSVFGYDKNSDIFKDLYKNLGGQGVL